MTGSDDSGPPGSKKPDQRAAQRVPVMWSVDCETEDTFLYAAITNISVLGIFVATLNPLPVGTELTLRFAPAGASEAYVLRGRVQWLNELRPDGDDLNPGMGIQFIGLSPEDRERLVESIRTIAYLFDDPTRSTN
jgi:type IV pilus assembly protein PilZ